MKLIFKNKLGFTLLEVMVTLGIVSVIGLGAMYQLKSSNQTVGMSLISSESSYVKNLVIANMSNPIACNNTFATMPVTRPVAGYPTLDLKDKNNVVFLTVGQKFEDSGTSDSGGNPLLKKNIFTITSIASAPMANTTKGLTITVGYDLDKNLQKPTKKLSNSFSVDVFISQNAGNVVSCFFDAAGMVRKAIVASCYGNSARYSPGTGTYGECFHEIEIERSGVKTPVTVLSGQLLCPAGQALYRAVTTDTPGTSTVGKVNFVCKDISTATPACTGNSYMNGIDQSTGKPICVDMMTLFPGNDLYVLTVTPSGYTSYPLNCPANQVVQKVTTGGPVCVAKVINRGCPVNQYVSAVDGAGNVTCTVFPKKTGAVCPAGQYVKQIYSNGATAGCGPLTLPANCGGATLNAIDSNGNATSCI